MRSIRKSRREPYSAFLADRCFSHPRTTPQKRPNSLTPLENVFSLFPSMLFFSPSGSGQDTRANRERKNQAKSKRRRTNRGNAVRRIDRRSAALPRERKVRIKISLLDHHRLGSPFEVSIREKGKNRVKGTDAKDPREPRGATVPHPRDTEKQIPKTSRILVARPNLSSVRGSSKTGVLATLNDQKDRSNFLFISRSISSSCY